MNAQIDLFRLRHDEEYQDRLEQAIIDYVRSREKFRSDWWRVLNRKGLLGKPIDRGDFVIIHGRYPNDI